MIHIFFSSSEPNVWTAQLAKLGLEFILLAGGHFEGYSRSLFVAPGSAFILLNIYEKGQDRLTA